MSYRPYDLEERTFLFARDVRRFIRTLKNDYTIVADCTQVIKSSGSIGANYIEANEKLGEKDLKYRLKISRKEAKETVYWLRLLKDVNTNQDTKVLTDLIQEATELRKILSSIIEKIN